MIQSRIEDNIAILSFSRSDLPMNIIDESFIDQLDRCFEGAIQSGVKGLILTSSLPDFIAGGDLSKLLRATDPKEIYQLVQKINLVFNKIETSTVPVVCALNGTALGGGFELALACHARICLDDERIQIGLPEVTLGLMPGAGGTQRLPRMIGIQKSLPYLLQGKKLSPGKALSEGLIDHLASDRQELMLKSIEWIEQAQDFSKPWYQKNFKLPGGEVQSPNGYMVIPPSIAMMNESTRGNYPAPLKILRSIYEGLQVPLEQGLDIEARNFASLAVGIEAKNMIRTLFFGINACSKGVDRPKGVAKRLPKKVGILGAGVMGSGIAYVTARTGIPVVLADVSDERASQGKRSVEKLLNRQVEKKSLTPVQATQFLSLVETSSGPQAMKGCDLVIEAVLEDPKIKAEVIQTSESVMEPTGVFASNTSTLPITGLAHSSKRPDQFIGLHFFSPVDKMPLVEIILGERTSDEALAFCIDYVSAIKKTPIVVRDGRGFFTSRCFTTYIEEGFRCLNDGASPELIENAGKACGMPLGPLSAADSVGLDVVYHVFKQTQLAVGSAPPFMEKTTNLMYKELNRLGLKSGHGFYEYPMDGKPHLWPELKNYFKTDAKAPTFMTIQRRLLYRQALEAAKCLEEGVLRSPRDGDVGSILGWGFPAFSGGAVSFINFVGTERFILECKELGLEVPRIVKENQGLKWNP